MAASAYTANCRRTGNRKRVRPGGHRLNSDSFEKTLAERGGVTPYNLLTIPVGEANHHAHPAITPYRLADWWCRYLMPREAYSLIHFVAPHNARCGIGLRGVEGHRHRAGAELPGLCKDTHL